MDFNRSPENLRLFIDNTSKIYHEKTQPLQNDLSKDLEQGTLDVTKAEAFFRDLAVHGAREYVKEFPTKTTNFFTTETCAVVAQSMLESFLVESTLNPPTQDAKFHATVALHTLAQTKDLK